MDFEETPSRNWRDMRLDSVAHLRQRLRERTHEGRRSERAEYHARARSDDGFVFDTLPSHC